MPAKHRAITSEFGGLPRPLYGGSPCQCLAEFFREEFLKHHQCLEQYREYYSDRAITQAEEALGRILRQMEELSRRDDACEVVGQLLKQFDAVTKLSAFSEPRTFH
ncbi:MAG TPA: hypothetical protein VN700_10065 [Vicinamibacterales bacterium]|nr:hypothetical protein [Vicinamibacterales bacterium]